MPDINNIPDHLHIKGTTLEEGWSRFSPSLSLPVGSNFYVDREDNPLGSLSRALRLAQGAPPKYFFAGHRGCGKSTELNRLAEDPQINERYWPVKFSVREECDFNDLEVVDILLAIGAQIFIQYNKDGRKLNADLLAELEGWKNTTIEQLTGKGAVFETGAGFDIGAFFINALLKVKTEHFTRRIVREEIGGPRLSELIDKINLICWDIQAQSGREVLVIVEDMDKPPLKVTRLLFEDSFTNLVQPACAIVYTIPVAIYFDPAYTNIRDVSNFLPNIKLHTKGKPENKDVKGVQVIRDFITKRIDNSLITAQALDEAITASGGVFREMAHIMQKGIDRALTRNHDAVQPKDVQWAVAQIRSSYRRLLNEDDYRLLHQVRNNNEMLHHPEKLSELMHIMAALEYSNGENWCDVHPAIIPLLDDRQEA